MASVSRLVFCLFMLAFAALHGVASAESAHRVVFVISPTYTFCLSGDPSCSSVGRTSVEAKYKLFVTAKRVIRVKISREYELSTEDAASDIVDVASIQGYQAATDTLDVRMRGYGDGGYERYSARLGYAYQHPVGTSSAYHTAYTSGDWYFGRQIERGSDGPAHQFNLRVKLFENIYQARADLPQSFIQTIPYATFPLNITGTWRVRASYMVQRQFAGAGRLAPYSTRLSATLTRDFSPSILAYGRVDSTLSVGSQASIPSNQRVTTFVLGAEFTL
ncbi:MAG: hypothetical protein ACXVAS_08210 [Vulcanimicrobiaceae bacterium]